MKTEQTITKKITKTLWSVFLVVFLGTLFLGRAHGQVIYESSYYGGTIGEYNLDGTPINPSLLTGLNAPDGIAISGGNLYVGEANTVGEYNATTGATINASLVSGLSGHVYGVAFSGGYMYLLQAEGGVIGQYNLDGTPVNTSFITGLSFPRGFTISGGNIYVGEEGKVSEYNATTGAAINASLVSLSGSFAYGVAVSGGNLYVSNYPAGTVGEYDATTGATINSSFVSSSSGVTGLSLFGGKLFVGNEATGTIGEYDATTGAMIDASLISGIAGGPAGIDVEAVPEPSTWAAGLLTTGALLCSMWRRRKTAVRTLWNSLLIIFAGTLFATQAHAQIYETNYNAGTIGEYDATTGATINAALVSGLSYPNGIWVSGGHLWVGLGAGGGGHVGEYDATTGAPINPSLISVGGQVGGITVSGNNLYLIENTVASNWRIGVYDATTGAPINASLVTGLTGCVYGVAVSEGKLYVIVQGGCYGSSSLVAVYDATTGVTLNPSLVSIPAEPGGITDLVVSGGTLWLVNQDDSGYPTTATGSIGEYDATTGVAVNASLVTRLNVPSALALSGGKLFVGLINGIIGEYNATTGAIVNSSLVSGIVQEPSRIAVVLEAAPPTITVTDAGGNAVACGGVKTVSNNGQCGAVTVPLTIAATGSCPGTVTVASTRGDGKVLTDPYPVGLTTVTVTATDACGATSTCTFTVEVTSNKSIASNFNGTAIPAGSTIWFNSVLKPSGLDKTSGPVTVKFFNQTITSSQFTVNVPDTTVVFDPHATCASAMFANGQWMISAPKSGLSGNTFLSGASLPVPNGLPGGIKPVTWSGTFITDTAGVTLNWQWASAVYTAFNANNGTLGVKATDDNHHDCTYLNSDHAGTPEQYKAGVIGGAMGGGGSNYTGGLSGTQSIAPCDTF